MEKEFDHCGQIASWWLIILVGLDDLEGELMSGRYDQGLLFFLGGWLEWCGLLGSRGLDICVPTRYWQTHTPSKSVVARQTASISSTHTLQ